MLFEIQNFTEQNKINREAKQGANRPERVEAAPVWLPVCVFTDNHFMARFQDWSSSSMRTFVCMFHLIFLAVERESANRCGDGCGCGLSLLPGWFSLSEGFFRHALPL